LEEKQTLQQDDEINLLDYLIVLAKRKKLILQITFGAAIIAAIISLILPPIYKAETKILPPQQQSTSMAAQFMSQIGELAGLAGSVAGIKTTDELYISMFKTRPILDNIIDRFKLMEVYKTKSRENARKSLLGRIKIRGDKKSGIITVGIEDKDPKMAADIANAFVEELKKFNKGLAVTEASQRRLFFEEQLNDVKISLVKAEEAVRGFQEKTEALEVKEQAKAVIEGIANLKIWWN
jgi:capsular polysaccharide biosynthesis protein